MYITEEVARVNMIQPLDFYGSAMLACILL